MDSTKAKRLAVALLMASFAAVAAPVGGAIADTPADAKAAEKSAKGTVATGAEPEAGEARKQDTADAGGDEPALKDFSEQAFLDAAFNNCATVENRSAKSCNCEQKLIGDRLALDDKQMAYLYWTNKPAFVKRFEAKKTADADFAKAFSDRFSGLQALIIAACGA